MGFIEYAVAKNIVVLCYPPHCTHVLQGLDVVAFAAFKKIWMRRRDQWVTDNPFASFGKTAWVSVWTAAFSEAMTESTIKASFKKTGVVPFDPSVITEKMMAPSIQHSSHGDLPLPLASPVRKLIRHHHAILHQSDQARSPTRIQPSQDVHMFIGSTPTSMTVNNELEDHDNDGGKGNDDDGSERIDNDGGEGVDNDGGEGVDNDGDEGVDENECEGDDENERGGDDDACSDILLMDKDGNDIIPPAVATRRETERLQRETQREVVIDPALLADRHGGQSLAAALSTSSASILVTTETMISTYCLPKAIYGPRPAIPAADHAILRTPKATSPAGMSAQIDDLRVALDASHARENEARNTHDAQAAQLGLAGMLVNKSQFQLATAEQRRKKPKGIRIESNGFARIVTHSSLLEASKKMAQDSLTKTNLVAYRAHLGDDWKVFNDEQVEAHSTWKAEKGRCKAAGEALTMSPPNPLVKKWEWVAVYPPFDGEIDGIDEDW
jgi:hypothetical protein